MTGDATGPPAPHPEQCCTTACRQNGASDARCEADVGGGGGGGSGHSRGPLPACAHCCCYDFTTRARCVTPRIVAPDLGGHPKGSNAILFWRPSGGGGASLDGLCRSVWRGPPKGHRSGRHGEGRHASRRLDHQGSAGVVLACQDSTCGHEAHGDTGNCRSAHGPLDTGAAKVSASFILRISEFHPRGRGRDLFVGCALYEENELARSPHNDTQQRHREPPRHDGAACAPCGAAPGPPLSVDVTTDHDNAECPATDRCQPASRTTDGRDTRGRGCHGRDARNGPTPNPVDADACRPRRGGGAHRAARAPTHRGAPLAAAGAETAIPTAPPGAPAHRVATTEARRSCVQWPQHQSLPSASATPPGPVPGH